MKATLGNMVTDLNAFRPRLDYLKDPLLANARIELGILRLDQIHPVISGNKWFKLKENLLAAKRLKKQKIVTFGGAYSNHLIATAYAARQAGLGSVGIVRGIRPESQLTDTLKECMDQGMLLRPVTRDAYAQKMRPEMQQKLQLEFPYAWIIPEGGRNLEGIAGVAGIAGYIPQDATLICLPVGSGTTFVGLRNSLPLRQQMLGFVPLKKGAYLQQDILGLLNCREIASWQLNDHYHFGGFARYKPELIRFINDFFIRFEIRLDFVYTGKMMYGLWQMIQAGTIREQHIIVVHTGGLQGNRTIRNSLIF